MTHSVGHTAVNTGSAKRIPWNLLYLCSWSRVSLPSGRSSVFQGWAWRGARCGQCAQAWRASHVSGNHLSHMGGKHSSPGNIGHLGSTRQFTALVMQSECGEGGGHFT